MADGIDEPRQVVRATDEHAAESPLRTSVAISRRRTARPEPSPHSAKFRAVTATLIGFAIGAIVIALALVSNTNTHTPSVPWSSWSPPDNGDVGARDIADHIAPLYRISGTDQLAVVTVVDLANATAAAAAAQNGSTVSGLQVAVQTDASNSQVSLLSGNTVAYDLCGIGGSNCAIGVGAASTQRLLLLRREALELALYTFKYISGTSNVVAILPPGHTTLACTGICSKPNERTTTAPVDIAVLFIKQELQPWLSTPLANTLPEEFPPTVDQIEQAPEAPLVDQITARGLFNEHMEQAQDGSNLVVLQPLPPQ